MKRYLGIFILTVMVGLSGCASDTDSDTQVSSRAYSMQIQQNQNRVQTFNGRRQTQVCQMDLCGHRRQGHIRIKMVIFWIRMAPRSARPDH